MKQSHSTYHQKLLYGFHLCVSLILMSLHQNFAFSKMTSLHSFKFRLCWIVSLFLCTGSQPTIESSVQLSASTLSSWLPPQHGFCRQCRDGREIATTQQNGEERDLKLGGWAGPREQRCCGTVPGKETAGGVWGKDREGITPALGQARTLCRDIQRRGLREGRRDTDGWQPQHNLLKD